NEYKKSQGALTIEDFPPNALGEMEKGKAPENRTIFFDGKNRTLVYQKTDNREHLAPDERVDVYGTYDVYVETTDDENTTTEYQFLYNTDLLLCYIQFLKLDPPNTKILSENEIKVRTDEFLSEYYNKDEKREYIFDKASFSEEHMIYDIKYNKEKDGWRVDDVVHVSLIADGSILFCSNWNRRRFDNFDLTIYDKEKTFEAAKEAAMAISKEYEEDETHPPLVKLDDKGNLVLFYFIKFEHPTEKGFIIHDELLIPLVKK
ncbi:MAG: hypothetical protein FWD16_07800, partial [Clostridia bacterium]|nr:hypothetical protein [Clostridia bacterium]